MRATPIDAVADALTVAIAANDAGALGKLYHDDAVIWHCTDERELGVSEVQAAVRAIGAIASGAIEVRSRFPTASGFVQTQVNTYRRNDGAVVRFAAALVVTLDGAGLIRRVEEYLDGACLTWLAEAPNQIS